MQIRKAERANWLRTMHENYGSGFDRLIAKVTFKDLCWIWNGKKDGDGYGVTFTNGKPEKAHRKMFSMAKGKIGDGLCVRHVCDNPSCVSPLHLITGTHLENMRDRALRGRGADLKGENNGRSKITANDAQLIRCSDLSLGVLARRYGLSKTAIRYIKIGKNWR